VRGPQLPDSARHAHPLLRSPPRRPGARGAARPLRPACTICRTRGAGQEYSDGPARLRGIQGQIVALERSVETEPDFIALLQRAAAARGAMSGVIADLMEERLRSLQVIAESDEARAEVAEMIDIVHGYLA
jgi:DNA-binding FrmR family transcriptional regulator